MFYLLAVLFYALFTFGTSTRRRQSDPEHKRKVSIFLRHGGHPKETCCGRFLRLGGGLLGKGRRLQLKIGCMLPPLSGPINGKGGAVGRPLFKGTLTDMGIASGHLRNTYFCMIDKRKNPSPKTVNEVNGVRLRRSRCTCSITLHLTHGLVRRKTRIHVVVRSTGSKVHSSGCLSGDGHRAYVKTPVPLGRITHLQRHYTGVGRFCGGSHGGCGCYHTVFLRISDHDGDRRASIFFCRSGDGPSDGHLTGAVGGAFRSGCSGRRPGHKFAKAIDTHGLCILTGASPTSMFIRLKGVRGAFSRHHFMVDSGHRTLTG